MSNEELVELIKNGIDIDQNYTLLCEKNKGIVIKTAKKYIGSAEMEDLLQEGYIGLMTAVKYYEPGDTKFITYALYWIKQLIVRYANNNGSVSVGINSISEIKKFKQTYDTFYNCFGKKPTMEHIAYCMGISEERAAQLELYSHRCEVSSLDICVGEESETTACDLVASNTNIEDEVVEKDYKEQVSTELWSKVDRLESAQAAVILERYKGQKTVEEVGQALDKPKNEVRSIQDKAIRSLRKMCNYGILKEYADNYIYGASIRNYNFNTSWTSSTEYTALKVMGQWN